MKHTTTALCLLLMMTARVWASASSRFEFLLPLKIYGENLIVVQGGLGDLQERNLLIDTGTYPTAIDGNIARELKLKTFRGESRALGQNIPASGAIMPRIEIGPLNVKSLPVVIEDLESISKVVGIRIDALIGLDVLARANFQIDYTEKEVSFGAPARLSHIVPMVSGQAMAMAAMNIGGHTVRLLIDTGAARTVVFSQRAPWLKPRPGRSRSFTGLSGRVLLNEVNAREIGLESLQLASNEVFLSDGANMSRMPFDGLMSTWAAHLRRIAFDFEHDIFSWDNNDEAPRTLTPRPQIFTASGETNLDPSEIGAPSSLASHGDGLEVQSTTTISERGAGDIR